MEQLENKKIFNDFADYGEWQLIATHNGAQATKTITIFGPNLRTTEEDSSHLLFHTSDNKFLNIKE